MASKTLLFLLGLAILVVAASAWEGEEEETEEIAVEDLQDFFMQVEKRGPKVGPCKQYNGKPCALCNLKIKNRKDMRRYIACAQAGNGRKI